ncbi:glucans biosynthesis glucosyltransferase MdoH [Orrella marina]|uniref:Glucans biosynthesis glucosyltransferase H n=1 Tax=Orrella marina TaxID=2163011 RepID=A0A2R4XKI3_9BURK|nr:glucans biosynthesis glucosyltransferase MdoH [Orrella marina]AWB34327.1 glucans biosynthesis glucosyltransferase MdoH [Orrella marina]
MMTRRRVLFVSLVLLTVLSLVWLMITVLPAGPSASWFHWVIVVAFACVLPWTVIGFWNASIGLLIDLLSRNPLRVVNAGAAQTPEDLPLTESTALLLCIRNEVPDRLVRNLQAMISSLGKSPYHNKFHVYVLSDTTDVAVAAMEQRMFGVLADQWAGKISVTYRRRDNNRAYKAGNIEDFCDRWGHLHTFALVLDADSLMDASAIERLVRVMTANPQIGILQGLVVGLPSRSAFTRLFQFGMRLGMRSYTLGSAWWQGDCGPYWGHNAVLRIKPFSEGCRLPVLADRHGKSSYILSHDQVEAVLMRRAGYEVRVFPLEDQSYEENPPTLVEFIQRDLRWCAGNMQYVHLLSMTGLKFTSRVQLLLAILMFAGAPAWIVLLSMVSWTLGTDSSLLEQIDLTHAGVLLLAVMTMMLLPQLASAIGVLVRPSSRKAFGGAIRFVTGLLLQILFALMVTPILWVSQSVFLFGLLAGKRITWASQNREAHRIDWLDAIRSFGFHTLVGVVMAWPVFDMGAGAILIASLFMGGLWLAIPLAVLTSRPKLGEWLVRHRLLCLPEETRPPRLLEEIARSMAVISTLPGPNHVAPESR